MGVPWRAVGGLVAVMIVVFAAGCRGGGGPSSSPSPGESTATPTATASPAGQGRPTAQDFVVGRSRSPVSRVAATVQVGGFPFGVVVDDVVGEVYVSSCGSGQDDGAPGDLAVIDTATREVTATVPMGPCPLMAVDPYAGVLYAFSRADGPGVIRVIDTTTHQVTGTITVGDVFLGDMVVDPTTGDLYVSEPGSLNGGPSAGRGATVVVVDGVTGEVGGRVSVGPDSEHLAVDPVGGAVYVSDSFEGAVRVIDTATRVVTDTIQVVPGMDAIREGDMVSLSGPVVAVAAGEVYVSEVGSGTVYVIGTDSREVIDSLPAGLATVAAADPAAGVVYMYGAANASGPWGVTPIDTATHEFGDGVPVEGASALAVDPSTGAVWVVGGGLGTVTVLEAPAT